MWSLWADKIMKRPVFWSGLSRLFWVRLVFLHLWPDSSGSVSHFLQHKPYITATPLESIILVNKTHGNIISWDLLVSNLDLEKKNQDWVKGAYICTQTPFQDVCLQKVTKGNEYKLKTVEHRKKNMIFMELRSPPVLEILIRAKVSSTY